MKLKIEEREVIIKNRTKQNLNNIYDKICENTMGMNLNEIHIKYEIKKEDNNILRIFGDTFIKNNYNNCKIILNDKVNDLVSHLDIKKMKINKKLIEIKLRGIKSIIFANEMLFECSSLKSLPDISKWNTNNIIDMSELFSECSSLKSLPNISKWNTNNIINMYGLFNKCSSLKSLPDISKWNIKNVTNISLLFSGCSSLELLPNIS